MIDELTNTDLQKVTNTFKSIEGIDFSDYANSSLKRRINRIIASNNLRHIDELIEKLHQENEFRKNFILDITVNTTELFRDPSFWRELSISLKLLAAYRKEFTIWSVGCSTGEEVLSLSILCHELGIQDKVKILATDLNQEVLETAKKRSYSERKLPLYHDNYKLFNPNEDFSKYYSKTKSAIQFHSYLLDNVVFETQNLTENHQSETKYDLILCRNVMIYFNQILQEKTFSLFNNCLKKGGVLAIGAKESFVWSNSYHYYSEINRQEKIFIKNK